MKGKVMLAWAAQQHILKEMSPKTFFFFLRSSRHLTVADFYQDVILLQSNIILKTHEVHHKSCRKRQHRFTESIWVRNDDIQQNHMKKADNQRTCLAVSSYSTLSQ